MSLFDNFTQKPENNPDAAPTRDQKSVFTDHVKLQAYEDGYIDRKEERELLEYAINHGIDMDQALIILGNVAQQNGYVIERAIEDQAKELLQRFSVSGGVIDKKEFTEAVATFVSSAKGKIPTNEARRRLKKIVLENHWKVKEGGLFASNWFSEIS